MERGPTDQSITIYELKPDLRRYSVLAFADESNARLYERFNGETVAADWPAVTVTAADQDDSEAQLADFTLLGVVPAFSVRAAEALLDLLRPNGELLPLRYPRAEYMAYNVTRVVDVLDEERSAITRFKSSGRVMSIQRYAFRTDRVKDLVIFKIPQLPRAFVFVTDSFVQRVKQAGLTGFSFQALSAELADGRARQIQ